VKALRSEEKGGTGKTELHKFNALVRKADVEHPAPEEVKALRRMLEETPNLWREMGDLAKLSMHTVLTGGWLKPSMRISIEVGIDDIKRELGYQDAPALEKMLIDQIMVSWVQLQKAQMTYAVEPRQSTFNDWERRVNASSTRFLKACETLARVRKLSRPGAMQVNIGAQQVNVAQAQAGPAKIRGHGQD
jgi:hypothetical protein